MAYTRCIAHDIKHYTQLWVTAPLNVGPLPLPCQVYHAWALFRETIITKNSPLKEQSLKLAFMGKYLRDFPRK